MRLIKIFRLVTITILLFSFSLPVLAEDLVNEKQNVTLRAEVINLISERAEKIVDTEFIIQTIEVRIINGPQKGEIVQIINDYQKVREGNKVFVNHSEDTEGSDVYNITNIDRRGSLALLTLLFILAVIIFGKWQGVRSLLALIGSFFAIIFILIPGILNGWNPLLASFLVAGLILFAAIFFTHGFNRESAVAYSGTMIAVLLSGIFAVFAVYITSLSGFSSEETTYLNFNTEGTLNFTALLLGAFIIGFLGVLDDIAITQSAVVTELFDSNPKITRKEVYKRAMRVGREHVGALVNTLVLAYTGVSLPLLLYISLSPNSLGMIVSQEMFATEIVRIIVGSIGLILTVPIVTLLAIKYLKGYKSKHNHSHGHNHNH